MNNKPKHRLSNLVRLVLLTIAFSLSISYANGQTRFQRTYASNYADAWGYCVQETQDGGYIIAGRNETDDYYSYRNALLVKTAANGTVQWTFDYDLFNISMDEARYVIEVDDKVGGVFDGRADAYVFVGWTASLDNPPFYNINKDILAVKVDLNGNVLWIKRISDPTHEFDEQAFCVKQNPVTGNYAVTGSMEVQVSTSGTAESRLFLMELNQTTGNIVWDHAYGLSYQTVGGPETGGYSLDVYDPYGFGSPDGWVVTGWTSNNTSQNALTMEDVYVVTTDWVGNPTAQKRIGVSTGSIGNFSIERGLSVQQISTGDIVISGEYQGPSSQGGPAQPMLLSLTRNLGAVNFMRTYTGTNVTMNAAYCMRQTTNGIPGYILVNGGSTNNVVQVNNDPTPLLGDAIMFHTDPTGLLVNWGQKYVSAGTGGLSGYGSGHSVRPITNGYVMTGVDLSYQPREAVHLVKTDLAGISGCEERPVEIDVETKNPYIINHGFRITIDLDEVTPDYLQVSNLAEEFFCFLYKPLPSTGTEEPSTGEALGVTSYPNPVKLGEDFALQLEFDEVTSATITVSDVLGKVVYSTTDSYPAKQVEVELPTTGWRPGLYTVMVHSPGKSSTMAKVLVTD